MDGNVHASEEGAPVIRDRYAGVNVRYRRPFRPITTEEERDGIYKSLEIVVNAGIQPCVFVELGTRFAGSSYEIVQKLKTMLDDFTFIGVDLRAEAREFFNEVVSPLGNNRQRVQFVYGRTTDVVGQFPRSIAWVFIDANHSAKSCKEDTESYGELLCVGGHLVLHDTRARRPYGLRKYVLRSEYLKKRFKLLYEIESVNGLRVYEKRV